MNKGRNKTIRIVVIVAIAFIAIISALIVFAVIKRNEPGPGPEPETESVTEVQTEEETQVVEAPPLETEEEVPQFWYVDAHGGWHETVIDENAKPRQYPWGSLTHDADNAAYSVTDDEAEDYYELERGIDVSVHQGDINWYDVRSSRIDFAIIRAAHRGYTEGKLQVDENFEKNYEEAYKVGIRTGMYVFSQAVNEQEAVEEAELALSLIDGRPLDLFIAYDPESVWEEEARIDSVSREQMTRNAVAFCETIREGGYTPAIYSNMVWEDERFDMSLLADRYDFWYADYEDSAQSPYAFSAWQFSEYGQVGGIDGYVDLNVIMEKPREEREEEEPIYSYVQIPTDFYENSVWTTRKKCNKGWTGEWADIDAGGQKFFYFGCGICCLSNMVSTLCGYDVPPDVMYYETKELTSYHPDSGKGAVSWDELKSMCEYYGLDAKTKSKQDYETFKEDVAASETTMVVVCQDNDKRLWWYTRGHYVNVWDYDDSDGTVFVTDPSMHYNRQRVKLIDVYNALKTANPAQYMTVNTEEGPQE